MQALPVFRFIHAPYEGSRLAFVGAMVCVAASEMVNNPLFIADLHIIWYVYTPSVTPVKVVLLNAADDYLQHIYLVLSRPPLLKGAARACFFVSASVIYDVWSVLRAYHVRYRTVDLVFGIKIVCVFQAPFAMWRILAGCMQA